MNTKSIPVHIKTEIYKNKKHTIKVAESIVEVILHSRHMGVRNRLRAEQSIRYSIF